MKEKKTTYSDSYRLALLAPILSTISILATSCGDVPSNPPETQTAINSQTMVTAGVAARFDRPIPTIPDVYEEFPINTSEDQVIETRKGSRILIPAGSLVNSQGELVEGEAIIRYKEYRDMVDVFLSGIPMKYDSGGADMHFESAGMFDIQSEMGDEKLYVAEGKEITVEFNSENSGNYFNQYYYDEDRKAWAYLGKDQAGMPRKVVNQPGIKRPEEDVIEELELRKNMAQLAEELADLNKELPVRPEKAKAGELNMRVVFEPGEYPELAIYEDLQFQILNREEFKPEYAEMEWVNVNIEKDEKGNYTLCFVRPGLEKKFLAKPVFQGEKYQEALAEFDKKHRESKRLIAQREEELKQQRLRFAEQQKEWEAIRVRDSLARVRVAMSNNSVTAVMRQFRLKKFGIYNSDCKRNLPQGQQLAIRFRNPTNDELLQTWGAYLVERDKNALYSYYNTDDFTYNPERTNMLWMVTRDNKLAIYKSDRFDRLNQLEKGSADTLDMKIIEEELNSEEQIRRYLEI